MKRHNLKGRFVGNYKNAKGNTVFRYAVSGSDEALDAYEKVQGDYFTVDDETEKPLFFTTRYGGENVKIVVNEDTERTYVDNSEMEKIASQVSQYGGNLGQAMAQEAAKKLMSGQSSSSTSGNASAEESNEDSEESAEEEPSNAGLGDG